MQQLPQIVKVRLQQTARSEHPDADALTAFAERSLPNLERSVVMEHLARCGECREVLALALPEIEEVVMPALVRRPWLSMPALRWGAIAASLIVVLSVGNCSLPSGSWHSSKDGGLNARPQGIDG
jgi:hypothetical protein